MQEQRTEQPGRVTVTGRIVFEVRRTSGAYREQARPCIEAEPGTLPYWDYRTFKSPEEHDAKLGEKWHDRGTEHQVEHGPRGGVQGIKRRLEDRRAWFVSFADLDELMRFYKKYGQLVITASHGCDDQACVEIYDDYRE